MIVTDDYTKIRPRKGYIHTFRFKIEVLRLSILKKGYDLNNPILVTKDLEIRNGNHRWRALNELKKEGKTFKYSYKIK